LDTTISVAILTIATVVAASIFAGVAIQQLYSFQNVFRDVSQTNQELMSSSVQIIGEAKSSSSSYISVWVKNIGRSSFRLNGGSLNASYWDVFLTFPDMTRTRFTYSATGSSSCWNAQILNDMGIIGSWEKGETIEIRIYTPSIPSGSYTIQLNLPNGIGSQDTFSIS
jgi:hypothetical protein